MVFFFVVFFTTRFVVAFFLAVCFFCAMEGTTKDNASRNINILLIYNFKILLITS